MIRIGLGIVALLALLVLLVAALAGALVSQLLQLSPTTAAQATGFGDFSSVASAALELQDHLIGSSANQYSMQDSLMQQVVAYWKTYCRTAAGAVCALAASGTLQCVQFVSAAQWLAGDPITDHPDAVTFWSDYAKKPGWQEIESPSAFRDAPKQAPHLGDMVVWKGGGVVQTQADRTITEVNALGHIAIVTGWQAPSATQDGFLEVAQANAPGNKYPPLSLHPYTASDQAGNTYSMIVHSNYTIDTWGAYTDPHTNVSYGAETILGFLHHTDPPRRPMTVPTTPQNGSYATTPPPGLHLSDAYVQEAWDDAVSAGIPPGYFIRQIQQESSFNPAALSPVGAIGIAQFMPGTAAGIPNPLGSGMLDPTNPHEALLAAARMMAATANTYQGNYAKALVAYNGGGGEVSAAEALAARNGDSWLNHLYVESRNYVHIIMGL